MRLGKNLHTLILTLSAFVMTSTEALAKGPKGCASASADVNCMVENFIDSSAFLPGLVSVAAYLTGLALGVKGVLDLKMHVTAGPREMPLRTPIIELVVSGLLLALPFTYEVLVGTVTGGGGFNVAGANFYAAGGGNDVYALVGNSLVSVGNVTAACAAGGAYDDTVGGIMCTMWSRISNLPGLFSGFSYIAGLTFMYFAAVSLKESVENPQQTPLWTPFKRFVVAALLLVFPYTLEVALGTLFSGTFGGQGTSGFNLAKAPKGAKGTDLTLDAIVGNFMFNIYGVFPFVIKGFGYIAGMTLIIIGIFRLLKTMEEGPRGPGGIGTIMTFVTGSALLALGPIVASFSQTLFDNGGTSATSVLLAIPGGGLTEYTDRMQNFISAVLAYMLILGWVSFVRGLFIFRSVAEGDQQASMMSAVTHLLGGAILVNLGPFLNVVQDTLGPIAGLPTITFT